MVSMFFFFFLIQESSHMPPCCSPSFGTDPRPPAQLGYKVKIIIPMQMHCLTSSIRPQQRKRSALWREIVPTVNAPMKPQKLLGLPPLSVLLHSDLPSPDPGLWREAGRQIHRSGQSFSDLPRLLPPASHCFYVISQPRCHGTEDGTSTLVLNDLLDDSLLVRHSCPAQLKCETERNEPLPQPREEGRGVYLAILF